MRHFFGYFSFTVVPALLGMIVGGWLLMLMPFYLGGLLGLRVDMLGPSLSVVLALDFVIVYMLSRFATYVPVKDGNVTHRPGVVFAVSSTSAPLLMMFFLAVQVLISGGNVDTIFPMLYLVLSVMAIYTGLRDGFKKQDLVFLGTARGR